MFDPEDALWGEEENKDMFLDREAYVKMWIDLLPHWEQNGKTQFITFRLRDSLPQSKLSLLIDINNGFLQKHPRPWSQAVLKEYHNLFSTKYQRYLDAGYGSCILQRPEIREILEEGLWHYDAVKYELLAYVIMPNHVHLVARMLDNNEANCTLDYVKRYCTGVMNKSYGTGARLFSGNWDRIVRNEVHLKYVLSYIVNNPKGLPQDAYSLGGRLLEKYLKGY